MDKGRDFAIIVTASRHSNPMNIQNKSTVYTINNAAPPSYAEATEHTASSTYNPESEQRYPHIMVYPSPSAPFPYPSNCYVNNTPVQSAYPEYESTERQNQPISVPYNGTLITAPTEYKSCSRLFQFLWVICTLASIVAIITIIIRAVR